MTKASSSAMAMVVTKDEWVTAAMTNDQILVELLLRLKQARTTVADNPDDLLPPSRWGVRQRRSRSSRFAVVIASGSREKQVDSVRGSPMTPLSWSGGSGCGGGSASRSSAVSADGFEETSLQACCSTSATGSGSKALLANEITSSFSKRSTKKKTLLELKHEENSLLKERLNLEKEIATMRTTIKEQSARYENLKRIKLDLNSNCIRSHMIGESNQEQACIPVFSRKLDTCLVKEEGISDSCRSCCLDGGSFLLPDLNMTPSEDDVCTKTLYGTS